MGKRQIGEMEPFELVITLVISELACIPMADRSIPVTFGIVAILTMFVIHQIILLLSKNSKMQGVISGKPVMVIDKSGVNLYALKQLNMQVSDLLQALRATNHFSIEEVDYGIMETNGQLTVVANKEVSDKQQTLPVPIIADGKWDEEDIERNNIDKSVIVEQLRKANAKVKNVALLTVDQNNRMSLQVKGRAIVYKDLEGDKLIK
ncbi:MAG: DUF421 domain-containing protein [Corallococcus sp.]|nr:DUF421 domain-containing protein [Corallococcus sp.]